MSESRDTALKPIVDERSIRKGGRRHGKPCMVCEICMKELAYSKLIRHHVKPLNPDSNDVAKGKDEISNIIVVGALCEKLLHNNIALLKLLILRVSQLNLNTYMGEGYIKFMPGMICQYSNREMQRAILAEKQSYVAIQKQKATEALKNNANKKGKFKWKK